MNLLPKAVTGSPLWVRVAPFLIFLGLTFCQEHFGAAGRYWFYLGKTVVGLWMIWAVRPFIAEMKWSSSWEAVLTGMAVFGLWVGLDGFYPKLLKAGPAWCPTEHFNDHPGLAWFFIVVRIAGSTLIVPPLEEVFYRSLLYRYLAKADFQSVPLGKFILTPFLVTAVIFGFAHREWLAGILCGFAYQGLVCWKRRLGDAMTAHAITNFLLGLWVVYKGAWHFW